MRYSPISQGDALKNSKDKLPFKTLKELDDHVKALESQLGSGRITQLSEEKRIVAEISSLKKHRKTLDGLGSQQSSVSADRVGLDTLRAQLTELDPLRTQLNKDLDAAKAELNAFESARKEAVGGMTDLFTKRNKVCCHSLTRLYFTPFYYHSSLCTSIPLSIHTCFSINSQSLSIHSLFLLPTSTLYIHLNVFLFFSL